MIHGIGYPKFYIYDSTGVTLQTVPANLGSSGCISLSGGVSVIDHEPEWVGVIHEDPPYTHSSLEEFYGYRYRFTLSVRNGDYGDTFLQYTADQATNKKSDIYKLKAIQAYADAGYKIKFTAHNDTESIWNTPFPIWVNTKIITTSRISRNRSDLMVMKIVSTGLLNSQFPFTAFDFATLNGVANANQCLSFNGSSNYLSCTEFSCSTLHSIEFWTKGTTFGASNYVMSGTTGTENSVVLGTTAVFYTAQTVSKSVTHGATAASLNHWFITRNGTLVVFYLNGAQIGADQTLASNPTFHINKIGSISGNFYTGKLGLIRVYNITATAAQVKQQYNAGYGQHPLNVALHAVWECNGTGGTSTTEDNQETTASRDMAFTNAPTRTTW